LITYFSTNSTAKEKDPKQSVRLQSGDIDHDIVGLPRFLFIDGDWQENNLKPGPGLCFPFRRGEQTEATIDWPLCA
jgi:hypothetical protein